MKLPVRKYDIEGFQKEIWEANYKGPDDESITDTWERIAKAAAAVEKEDIRDNVTMSFYSILDDFKFVPGGRIMANIGVGGRNGTTLLNCFVHYPAGLKKLESGISRGFDSIEGILEMVKAQALTLKSEGGYGTNFSYLRPAGTYVAGIGGRTPGVLKFMELWDKSSEIITNGSDKRIDKKRKDEKKKIRKGAQMAVLSVSHPEIHDFIEAKTVPGRLTKFNISVGITKGFMQAVESDGDWDLFFPDTEWEKYDELWDGDLDAWKENGYPIKVYETVKAKNLWNSIMKATYTRNEPGVMFLDIANEMNPINYTETILSSNPCLTGDMLLLTDNGEVPISELAGQDVNIVNYKGEYTTGKVWSNGIKPVYEISFYGKQKPIKCTNDHRWMTIDGDDVEARLLTGKKIMPFMESNPSLVPSYVKLGFIIGGGQLTDLTDDAKKGIAINFGEKDNDVLDYFGYTKNDFDSSGRKIYTVEFTEDILDHGIPLKPVWERYLSDELMTLDKNELSSLICGLYSANGSVVSENQNHGCISLTSTSKKLIDQIQKLLKDEFGIYTGISVNKPKTIEWEYGVYTSKESYDIRINSFDSIKRFKENIGFIHLYKTESLRNLMLSKSPTVKNVVHIGDEEVFDFSEPETHWGVVNSFVSHNCGELLMGAPGVCLLGSINLVKFIKRTDEGLDFDYDQFKTTVNTAVRLLDNVNDISRTPLPEYDESMKSKRRIGLGVMGLGSLHFMLGIRYGSKESLELIKNIWRVKAEQELIASAKLGNEKGSFPLFDREKYFNTKWWNTVPISSEIKDYIKNDIGEMRNSIQSMNAPTGNTGIFAGIVSGGIEPVFLPEYTRWVTIDPEDRQFLRDNGIDFPEVGKGEWYENEHFKFTTRGDEEVLKGSFGGVHYEIDKNRGLTKGVTVRDYGWDFVLKNYSETDIKDMENAGVFATTADLKVEDHISTLELISSYINTNSSKTVNIPNDYSFDDFKEVYVNAYRANIKGITTYRAGTMTAVLEKVEETAEKMEEYATDLEQQFKLANGDPITEDLKLPDEYEAIGKVIRSEGKKWYFHIGFADRQKTKPYVMFVHTNARENVKSLEAVIERIESFALSSGINMDHVKNQIERYSHQSIVQRTARAISLLLRHNIKPWKVIDIISSPTPPIVGTLLYSIKKVLMAYCPNQVLDDEVCPNCGEKMQLQEGCVLCIACGYSKC